MRLLLSGLFRRRRLAKERVDQSLPARQRDPDAQSAALGTWQHASADNGRRKRGARIDPHGYDAGKKIKGKKRHVLVDTLGLLLHAIVHPADIQDRDGGVLLLATLFGMYPFLQTLFADAGYQGRQFHDALKKILPHLRTQIIKRSDQAKGFVVLPKRWIVERTLAWLNRCRRLTKDWENLNRTALAFLRLASIRLMLRKLCNPH